MPVQPSRRRVELQPPCCSGSIAVPSSALSSERHGVLRAQALREITTAFIFADMLVGGIPSRPDFLTGASTHTSSLATGASLLAGQFGVVGIAVLLFPWCRRGTAWRRC